MDRALSAPVLLLALALSLLAAVPARAQESPPPPGALPRLKVGVVGTPPFVVRAGGDFRGFSMEVWRAMALRAGYAWELVPVDTVPQAFEQVRAGALDVAVGPLSITSERLRQVSFTQPYFQSSLAILAPRAERDLEHWLSPFLNLRFLSAVGGLLLVLAFVGLLLWLAERRANPSQFPASPAHGIGNGLWLAIVTMSTVGYGDRAPVTLAGRIIAGVWMLVALLTFSSLTAGIATALTLKGIEGATIATAEQLENRRVAVVQGSTAEAFVLAHGGRPVPVEDLSAAITLVREGGAEATVFDRPMLQYHLLRHPDEALFLSDGSFEPQGYGFALRIASPLQHPLNVALLELQERLAVETLRKEYLGN